LAAFFYILYLDHRQNLISRESLIFSIKLCMSSSVDVLSEMPGIRNVNVSLKNKEASVTYDNNLMAEQIATYIEDMGFNAYVKETDDLRSNFFIDKKKKKKKKKKTKVVPQTNGTGDVKGQVMSKCFLHVTVCYASYFLSFMYIYKFSM